MNDQQEKDAYQIVLGRAPEHATPDGRTAMQFIYDAKGELDSSRQDTQTQLAQKQESIDNLQNIVNQRDKQVNDANAEVAKLNEQLKQAPAPPAPAEQPPPAPSAPSTPKPSVSLPNPLPKLNEFAGVVQALVSKFRLPLKDSATWRGGLTALQTLGAVLAWGLADPTVGTLVQQFPAVAGVLAASSGVVAAVVGIIRRDVKNY